MIWVANHVGKSLRIGCPVIGMRDFMSYSIEQAIPSEALLDEYCASRAGRFKIPIYRRAIFQPRYMARCDIKRAWRGVDNVEEPQERRASLNHIYERTA